MTEPVATILKAFTAGATKEGLALCATQFEDLTGIRIEAHTTHGHLIEEQIIAGEVQDDIVLLPSAMIDNLTTRRLVSPEPRVTLGTAVRDGIPLPALSSIAAFEKTLLAARSIVITQAPSGMHLDRVIAELGLAGEIADRITRYDMGYMVNDHLVASTADDEIGFGVATEFSFYRDRGITYDGPLPEEIQMALEYEAAMVTRSDQIAAIRQLFEFLTTTEARVGFAETGVEI